VKVVFAFLAGFAVSYLGYIGYVLHHENKTEVLAQTVESTITPTPTPTLAPTPTLTPVPTPAPLPILPKPATARKPTPTPTIPPGPTTTPDVWSPTEYEPLISQYAGQYGVDKNVLERLANCESHFNPNAVSGDYLGMFQFSTSTWQKYRIQMGLDPNPAFRTNAEESIKTAAFVISLRGTSPWPACL
jgi:hypothetical protein